MKTTDDETTALDLVDKLFNAGAVSIHAGDKSYVICDDEIADATHTRELRVLLRRIGALPADQTLSNEAAHLMTSNLVLFGIHADEWLNAHGHQADAGELEKVVDDFRTHGDVYANDTKLRFATLKMVQKHHAELRKALTDSPMDPSVHIAKIKKLHPEYFDLAK
jgi:hypothetical protein